MRQTRIIEALLFASDAPLTAADLARVDERLDEDTVVAIVQELRTEYEGEDRAFQIYEVAGGYQLLTRPEYAPLLERFETVPQAARLSIPALEVLAIIAYRQPLGRAEIEEIRGVQSGAVLRTLQDRALVDVVGRSEGLGRPLLYGTTAKFLEHFGFRSLEDLPRPDELPVVLRERPAEPAADGIVPVADVPGEPSPGLAGQPRPEAVDESAAQPVVGAAEGSDAVAEGSEPTEADGETESAERPDEVGAGVGRGEGEGGG